MEKAGRIAAKALAHIKPYIQAGISTEEIDRIIHEFCLSHGATPAPLGYHGFPKACCTSINEVVCHGVPGSDILKDGDIINVDVTAIVDGYHGDTSATFFVGQVSDRAQRITQAAYDCMMKGIEAVIADGTTGDIGFAVNKLATQRGYHVVRDIGGHGIGRKFHEEPFVPSYGKKGRGDRLHLNGTITVEPMINETAADIIEHDIPGSTIKWYTTGDRTLSAQFEHTVLITERGAEILTYG